MFGANESGTRVLLPWADVRKFLDRIVPTTVIAGSEVRYPSIDAGVDSRRIVESLAKPASTRTSPAETGTDRNQSVKSSVDRSRGLTSSLSLILKRSLGYSGSRIEEPGDVSAEFSPVLIADKAAGACASIGLKSVD